MFLLSLIILVFGFTYLIVPMFSNMKKQHEKILALIAQAQVVTFNSMPDKPFSALSVSLVGIFLGLIMAVATVHIIFTWSATFDSPIKTMIQLGAALSTVLIPLIAALQTRAIVTVWKNHYFNQDGKNERPN